jgi:hypothetical protein
VGEGEEGEVKAPIDLALGRPCARMSGPDDVIPVNCGRCGKQLLVRVPDHGQKVTIECERCASEAPYSVGSVYVVFHETTRSSLSKTVDLAPAIRGCLT